jgi:spoIIIJ-associated protein
MIRIEALTLEEAYQNAASSLECSVTELKIEVVQSPSNGFLGMFKKSAIIVAVKENSEDKIVESDKIPEDKETPKKDKNQNKEEKTPKKDKNQENNKKYLKKSKMIKRKNILKKL